MYIVQQQSWVVVPIICPTTYNLVLNVIKMYNLFFEHRLTDHRIYLINDKDTSIFILIKLRTIYYCGSLVVNFIEKI